MLSVTNGMTDWLAKEAEIKSAILKHIEAGGKVSVGIFGVEVKDGILSFYRSNRCGCALGIAAAGSRADDKNSLFDSVGEALRLSYGQVVSFTKGFDGECLLDERDPSYLAGRSIRDWMNRHHPDAWDQESLNDRF